MAETWERVSRVLGPVALFLSQEIAKGRSPRAVESCWLKVRIELSTLGKLPYCSEPQFPPLKSGLLALTGRMVLLPRPEADLESAQEMEPPSPKSQSSA